MTPSDFHGADAPLAVAQPSLDEGADIGLALKAAREFRGLTTQDVADATRIRQSYIEALEDMRLEDLPSRPFTIGYVRAYAGLLGLDGDAAVPASRPTRPTRTANCAPRSACAASAIRAWP
jgi:cytoskeleton protein RodZ